MRITIGNVVRGENFFNRGEIIKQIWDTLQTDSILLVAPRRVGKSSIMQRLIDVPEGGFRTIFLDAQNFSGPEDLVTELVAEVGRLQGDVKGFFKKILGNIGNIEEMEIYKFRFKLREAMKGRWQIEGESVIRDVLENEGKLLIILDELPLLLHKMIEAGGEEGKQKAGELLDWLRYLRMHHELNTRIRQIIGGSIGLPRIAAEIGATHKINDLRQIPVGPLSTLEAKKLAELLFASRGVEVKEDAIDALIETVETLFPIFIQIMVSCVSAEVRDMGIEVTPQLVRECYQERALGQEYRITFDDYYERLDRYYSPDEARAAKRILRELASAPDQQSRSVVFAWYLDEIGPDANEEGFNLLLTWLADDFYIGETNNGLFSFTVHWLKDWWRKYHGR